MSHDISPITRVAARHMLDLFGPDGEGWTQNTLARAGLEGHSCDVNDPAATCWCLEGALAKVLGSDEPFSVRRSRAWLDIANFISEREVVKHLRHSTSLIAYNDEMLRSFSDVRALLGEIADGD